MDQLNVILAISLALSSIFSPIFTTWLNNKHQYNLRKLEIEADRRKTDIQSKKDIYMGFLQYAGKYLYLGQAAALQELGEYIYRLLPLVSPELREKLIQFDKTVANNRLQAHNLLDDLIPDIKKELEELN